MRIKKTVISLSISMALGLIAADAMANPTLTYVQNSLSQSSIKNGPWVLHQETPLGIQYDASGIIPPKTQTAPPYTDTGTPYKDYCNIQDKLTLNPGLNLMQPYYFPFVRNKDGVLEGFFDYRPRNEDEATVSAVSYDMGKTWKFVSQGLELNRYCPADSTDPDNQKIIVNSASTAYGSSSDNAADNGLGHAYVMKVNGVEHIYHLNRANNHIDLDQLVVHTLHGESAAHALGKLPQMGYVSPLASGGYPALESTATATTGLVNPDAIMGSMRNPANGSTMVVYVSKVLNGDTNPLLFSTQQQCGPTPAFALPNILGKKARIANHDVTSVRVATTKDGINFTDLGSASGLNDQTTTALNGIRWLGSGSIIPLADGRYGMFFGAGNCLDNDSDGFHFVGYAETVNQVKGPSDLQSWNIVYDFDHPILSTDALFDSATLTAYPANTPLVNVTNFDALTPAQVFPFTAPTVYATNFFSGRVYDPQAVITGDDSVTIVFAGYNTPQPSLNLGDYRTIGRVQLKFPAGYLKGSSDD